MEAVFLVGRQADNEGEKSPPPQKEKIKYKVSNKKTLDSPTPTWGQIKNLTRQAQTVAGPGASPEQLFLAILAILSCQVSMVTPFSSQSESGIYWAYFPDPPTLQVVPWTESPLRVTTNAPRLLGGSWTSHSLKSYPINLNFSFHGLVEGIPICFNFPLEGTRGLITPTKEGCVQTSKKAIITDSPLNKGKKGSKRFVWVLLGQMPGISDEIQTQFGRFNHSLPFDDTYERCSSDPPSDDSWGGVNYQIGYPQWRECIYDSMLAYKMGNSNTISIQDWSNPNPKHDLKTVKNYTDEYVNWENSTVPWPLSASRWHHNALVPPMVAYQQNSKTFWQPELWRAVAATSNVTLKRPNSTLEKVVLACLPSPYVFLFVNDSNKLQIYLNQTGGPTIVDCDTCFLSSCLSPRFNVSAFIILKRPPYLMVPVNLTTYWYDNYGLAVLQHVKELMRIKRFAGLLVLGISALIMAISSAILASVSLAHQVHTAAHVNDLSKNVSLTLATQEAIDRKLEMKVNALEEAVMHIGTELQALKTKLALSCHADYKWICVTPLKVNETDYNWERIQNHISGVWNSSSISLDLERLHQQIANVKDAKLDFTVVETAHDFFNQLSSFISGKGLISGIMTWVSLGCIVLVIILILPCIV
ncbi:endogenous retrovirus group K member 25 Env polyprotein-like [Odocoileus virginianus]|uniref:Endogenous retrovirus group K member 25 Env polyprotein-like n=1 Tax=Odocoileus virginianus TaxID=9874 RepID=A0ABM4HBR9_ODOVR